MKNFNEDEQEEKKSKSIQDIKLQRLKELRDRHQGEWLTMDACKEYYDRAQALLPNGKQDIGERRELRIELQNRFGIAEIEAINILDGYHIQEYVEKYNNIRNMRIPNEPVLEKRIYISVQNEDYWFEEKD